MHASAPSTVSCHPAANFDRIARLYRFLEYLTLGSALRRTRDTYLSALQASRNALVLGDGDGRFLAALLRSNPHLNAIAVDSSSAMLGLLAGRCAFASDRLTLYHAEALTVLQTAPASTVIDLVITHFFLDCFAQPELDRLVPAVRHRLSPGALWVVSDFHIPTAGLLRPPARLLVRALYLAFRLLTGLRPTALPDHAAVFRCAGLRPVAIRHRLCGLLTAELWQLPGGTHP